MAFSVEGVYLCVFLDCCLRYCITGFFEVGFIFSFLCCN